LNGKFSKCMGERSKDNDKRGEGFEIVFEK
jgi:hypothetical protein